MICTMDTPNLLYRPNVCMLVFNQEKKLFLGERFGEPNHWQFPQGGVEPNLTLEENVLKELKEELGATKESFRIIKRLNTTFKYEWVTPPKYATDKWKGQEQTFWLVEYLGNNEELNLERYEQEFMSYRWCDINQVKTMAYPRRLKGYLPALAEYEQFLEEHKRVI